MATITTSGLVTSWTHTPQAGDDSFTSSGLSEDATAVFYLDVMANDLGGKAKALAMLNSKRLRQAFDLSAEPQWLRDAYGRHTYGQSCLLARRLVEAGAKFVTVYFSDNIGGQSTTGGGVAARAAALATPNDNSDRRKGRSHCGGHIGVLPSGRGCFPV